MGSVYNVKKVVMRGNWEDGFEFYGPFEDTDDAQFFIDGFFAFDEEVEEMDDADPRRIVAITADLLSPRVEP